MYLQHRVLGCALSNAKKMLCGRVELLMRVKGGFFHVTASDTSSDEAGKFVSTVQ